MLCRSRWILVVFTLAFAACGSSSARLAAPVDGSPGDSPWADLAEGAANIIVSQTTVDFGAIDVGVTSPPAAITVTNIGTATSDPLSVLVTGAGITAVGCDGTTLAPQATCNISVTINQTSPARISGTVEVGENPGNTKKIAVTVIAITPGMIFTLSPSPLDLGSVLMGKSVSGTIVLTNASFFDMTSVGIAVSGAGFSLSPTGTCIGTLGPQQSCNIVVSFTAGTTAGLAKGTVTVRQGGVTKTVAVTATVLSNPEQADAGAPDLVSADVARWTDTLDSDVFFGWDQARIADMGTGWWVNAQKGKFFISTRLRIADAMDGTGRPLAISITEIVTNKSGSTALSLVPLPSELSGKWIYDPEKGETAQGPVVATTFDEASRFFDGGADPFYNSAKGYSAKVSAWANYRETPGDAAYYLDLRIWEMASAADAASLYNDLLQFAYWSPDNVPWKTCQGVAGNPCP